METEPLNPSRAPAPAPRWSEAQLFEAQEKYRTEVKAVLSLLPRWRFSFEEPGLSNFRRDVLFFLWGVLVSKGIDVTTAGELAADLTIVCIDRQIDIHRTQGNA